MRATFLTSRHFAQACLLACLLLAVVQRPGHLVEVEAKRKRGEQSRGKQSRTDQTRAEQGLKRAHQAANAKQKAYRWLLPEGCNLCGRPRPVTVRTVPQPQ
jgi:hypothetical protein